MPNDYRLSSSAPFTSARGADTKKVDYLLPLPGPHIQRPTSTEASLPTGLNRSAHSRWVSLDTLASRGWLYSLAILFCMLAAVGMRWVQDGRDFAGLNFITSDARGYYVYLPSMVIDGDLDFENQVRQHWDTESKFIPSILSRRTPLGLVRNKYPLGMSLTLIAPFNLAHGLTLAMNPIAPDVFRPDGYSVLYQLLCLLSIELMALGTLIMADAMITRQFAIRPRVMALAALLILLGSNYAWYVIREPFMVHVVSTFWVTAVLLLTTQIVAASRQGHRFAKSLAYLGLCTGMAIICRPSNVFIAPVMVWLMIQFYHAGQLTRRSTWVALTIAGCLASLPVMAQMSVWHAMTGHWIHQSYEGETFRWLAPRLFKTLFSSLHGLFTWTPLYILSTVGVFLWFRRSKPMAKSSTAMDEGKVDAARTDTAPSNIARFDSAHSDADYEGVAPVDSDAMKGAPKRSSESIAAISPGQASCQSESGKPVSPERSTDQGSVTGNRHQAGFLIALSCSAAILWYVNSSWHTWYFGWSFGGRAFLELLPLFILGLALLLERASLWTLARKRLLAGLILLMVIFNYGLMGLYQTQRIPRDNYPWGTSVFVSDPESISAPGL